MAGGAAAGRLPAGLAGRTARCVQQGVSRNLVSRPRAGLAQDQDAGVAAANWPPNAGLGIDVATAKAAPTSH
jgi:hypothetical protein